MLRRAGFTSLDTWKTSESEQAKSSINKEFVFRKRGSEANKWLEAIQANPLSLKHIQRFESCGSNAWIQKSKLTGHCRVTFNTCKLRICPVCSRMSANRIKSRLEVALQGSRLKKWRMITLTLKHSEETLAASIQKLRASFKALRKSDNWKKYIDGGYAVLEITRNSNTDHWHPHFHVVAGGCFYPWKELRDDWCKASNGSTFTDIRPIKTAQGAINYLTAYLAKMGSTDADTPVERLTEFYRTIQGQRFLIAFGSAPPPKKPTKSLLKDEFENICPLWQFVIALRDGQLWAITLDRRLHRKPLEELESMDYHPPPWPAMACT